ncbi:MAG: hypothetical protein SO373_06825 [Candidatus Borkfalkiaceae bacterium]|nr:hypothetical protein [Christensenellaceae bacterium]
MNNKKSLKDLFRKAKPEYLMIAAAAIIVLILFGSSFVKTQTEKDYDVNDYVDMLETKLSDRLSELDGAGRVKVIISVKSGMRSEIATEKQVGGIGDRTTETPVLISGKPLILGEIYPEICGVIIMAKGAENVKVRLSLITAAQTFLDVSSDKIQVLPMR